MCASQNIRYLTHTQIDKAKWDQCIHQSYNGLIYAYSFYLDSMAKNWDALVLNDYEYVMPLTWNKKYGIKYLYQPFLTAQLGIFGKDINSETQNQFLSNIPKNFRFVDIMLNSSNQFNTHSKFSLQRTNFSLLLNYDYETLKQHFNENTKRNIRKAQSIKYIYQKGFSINKVIEFARLQLKTQGTQTDRDIERFNELYEMLRQKNMANTYGIFSNTGVLLSSCVFFFSHNRAYYILVGNNPEGRNIGASHALINEFIKEYSGKNIILDFEGSDITTLANFYRGFGAREEKYFHLKINRLPFYLKWIKG